MEQVSNKAVIILLIAAVVVSIGGTTYSMYRLSSRGAPQITGMGTTGRVNASILSLAALNVSTNVDFGSGTLGGLNRSIDTNTSDNYGSFRNCSGTEANAPIQPPQCRGMEIENTGNADINITFLSDKTPAQFYDGTDSQGDFRFLTYSGNRTRGEAGSCKNTTTDTSDWAPNTWTTIPTSAYKICANLTADSASDTLTLEFNLTIPSDEPAGEKTATLTFTATTATS